MTGRLIRSVRSSITGSLVMTGLLVLGCGGGGSLPDRVPATGKVTVDGQPVEGLQITFAPKPSGRPCVGETDSSGNYQMMYRAGAYGVPPGEYTVSIQETDLQSENDEGESVSKESIIPAEFRFGMISVEVPSDGLEKDFDIKSTAGTAPAE